MLGAPGLGIISLRGRMTAAAEASTTAGAGHAAGRGISGHGLIYPCGEANDWDCTPAHRPYHALRAEAVALLDAGGIPLDSVRNDAASFTFH